MVRIFRHLALSVVLATVGCGGDGDDPEVDHARTAEETIARAFASDHEWIRAETVRLIGLIGAAEFRGNLTDSLDDASPVVQTAAIEALLRMGDEAVEEPALSRLVAGTEEQRLQLLELIVETGRGNFRTEVILRALRDLSADVQISSMRFAIQTGTQLRAEDLTRLIQSDDNAVAEQAFLTLTHFDRSAALDLVFRGLRSSDEDTRMRSMRFSRHLASANIWPTMRSYAAQEDAPEARRLALLVLGYLGDPTAEQPLRDILLSAEEEIAAEALAAISHIPTQRATDQPLVHRRDARRAVRSSALDQLVRQGRPTDDFEIFLDDQDPLIAERALLHMQASNPERAATLFSRALADTEDPRAALTALYRVSLNYDIRRFLDASSRQLLRYLVDQDPKIAGLAARLLVIATSPVEMQNRIRRTERPDALYALIEATYEAEGNFSDLYSYGLNHDLVAIRVGSALGILNLGSAYTPPAVVPEG